ncbi:Tryptophan synthase beta chain 2, chloroplastic [Morella rubra]|uniref:tryptophan synthase n=1 Tax=Morella rubra TaxID=262757 RepID=A0A6A1W9C6_9ROSI|nr:Tryptophan synthase beta chain 2, chloroplastic [Morella rubra]
MIAKGLGRKSVVAATGAGQHGIATASACAKLDLECTIFMGTKDMEKQSSNLFLMKLLGAKRLVAKLRDQLLLVRHGRGASSIAKHGSGSNALRLFHEFIDSKDVRLIGVEGAGFGLESGRHSATLARGDVGVYHGAMSYLLQDEEGQIVEPYSIATGLRYPGVSPELSFLKDIGRAEFYTATDEEALEACQLLCRLEGILPSLEASHALAFLNELCPTLPTGAKVVVNCSGRGDKDVGTLFNHRSRSM